MSRRRTPPPHAPARRDASPYLRILLTLTFTLTFTLTSLAASPRREYPLVDGWRTAMDQQDRAKFDGFEQPNFAEPATAPWRTVSVPHNWETYEGLRRLVHGNLHGYAWYRRTFDLPANEQGRRVFLFFEGVGAYATVWVNGHLAGTHAGGRVTFTLDVTDLVRPGASNVIAVRADHPAGITDLPWVCGGCSPQQGFSEGSQPLGLFRPVTVVTTNDARIEPFGIHVWNDATATAQGARVQFTAEVRNYAAPRELVLQHTLRDPAGRVVATQRDSRAVPTDLTIFSGQFDLATAQLWSLETPQLYTLETEVRVGATLLDRVETPFGIRTIQWPAPDAPLPAPFRLNGQPVFINGTCEYEHHLGASHAFSAEQISARVRQMHAAGFNAFRDAHQPHNLRYHDYWDRHGLLWWTQMAAQIWFDNPDFRANFKRLLRQWVRERRNSPSLVLWGLANESKLPPEFAAECAAIVRELDPTTSSQRLVTTCNGGTGTDWNVPQNWTGTYGGDPTLYADDLRRQRLIGEYGAWRSLGLHTEGGFVMDGVRSESRHDALMALKIRLAESVRTEVPGHFHWLFVTHENPGRTIGARGQQGSDGWAPLDRIGPANNKGNLTLWGEPTDAFFLFRASYAPASDPMVYIVSHTWPDRWDGPGIKNGLEVWSNCEEVELFNDAGTRSLGVRRRGGPGVPFRWDGVEITTDTLYAEGRVGGKTVARDAIYLRNLPRAANRDALRGPATVSLAGEPGWNYVYRVNAGGPAFTDSHGQRWLADQDLGWNALTPTRSERVEVNAPHAQTPPPTTLPVIARSEATKQSITPPPSPPSSRWGSRSWAAAYPPLPPRFASQRDFYEPIRGTADETLFHTYRYGRDQLAFEFAVPDGDYRVELYFAEPWYGRGGGDATAWRLFDVAINGETLLRDVDLWREAGYATAVKKVLPARARDGGLVISFPRVASYNAVLAGIAIATRDSSIPAVQVGAVAPNGPSLADLASVDSAAPTYTQHLPASAAKRNGPALAWTVTFGLGGAHDFALRYTNPSAATVDVEFRVTAADGTSMDLRVLRLRPTSGGQPGEVRIDGIGMNAGDYTVTVSPVTAPLTLESLHAN